MQPGSHFGCRVFPDDDIRSTNDKNSYRHHLASTTDFVASTAAPLIFVFEAEIQSDPLEADVVTSHRSNILLLHESRVEAINIHRIVHRIDLDTSRFQFQHYPFPTTRSDQAPANPEWRNIETRRRLRRLADF